MPGGKGNIRSSDGKPFSKDNPPRNGGRKPSRNIVEEVVAIMEGDAWTIISAELLDEDMKPTGEKRNVRFKTPTVQAAARAWAAKVGKADPRLLEMYMDRTLGKVPADLNLSGSIENKTVSPVNLTVITRHAAKAGNVTPAASKEQAPAKGRRKKG